MKKYLKTGVSVLLILLSIISIIGTSKKPPKLYENRIEYSIGEEGLEIKIRTHIKPARGNYRIIRGIYLYDLNNKRYGIFYDGDYHHGYEYFSEENGWESTETEQPVIQTTIDGDYFVIKIDKEYIKLDGIKIIWVELYGENREEIYIVDKSVLSEEFLEKEGSSDLYRAWRHSK